MLLLRFKASRGFYGALHPPEHGGPVATVVLAPRDAAAQGVGWSVGGVAAARRPLLLRCRQWVPCLGSCAYTVLVLTAV